MRFFIVLLILLGCIHSFRLHSQDDDSTHMLSTVTVSAERFFTLNASTLDYIRLRTEDLFKSQGNTFVNSLERTPGVTSINTGVGISKPVIRGLFLNRIIVNEFGIKQEGQQWGMDHGLEIDQFNVHEVEIVKGPVSLLYGSDGIGGVINILQPKMLPKNSVKAEVLVNYKSNNDFFGASAGIRTNRNDVFTDVRISYSEYASYRVPADTFVYNSYVLPIYNNRLKNTAGKELNASLLTGIKRKWGKTSVYVSNYRQDSGFFIGAFGSPKAYQLTDDGEYRKIGLPRQEINHFKVVSNTHLHLSKSILEMDFGYQYNLRKELSRPHAHGNGLVPEGNMALQLDLHTLSGNMKHRMYFNRWKIANGISGQYQHNISSGYEFLIPGSHTFQTGIFNFSEFKVNERFLIAGGARLDFAEQSANETHVAYYNNQGQVVSTQKRSPEIDRSYFNASGSIGMAYKFNEKASMKMDAGTAFRIPSIVELASNGVHHGTFRHEFGDSSLTSERGYLFNPSFNFKNKRLMVSFSPFLNYFTNYIYLRPSSKFSPLPDAGQIYQYVEGEVLFTGFEWSTDVTLFKTLKNNLSVEYVWNQNLNRTMPLPFTPPFSIRNELEFTPKFKQAWLQNTFVMLWGQYFAPQYRTDLNEPETDGYFLLNCSIGNSFVFNKNKLSLLVQLRNITNSIYLNNMSRYRILNLPEQGFNTQVLLKYEFN